MGEGPQGELTRAVRAHANTVEYLPLALLLLLLLELGGTAAGLLHGFGASLLLGRLAYVQGVLVHGPEASPGRFMGTLVTWGVIALAALMLLWQAATAA